jgi:hypothetical protein
MWVHINGITLTRYAHGQKIEKRNELELFGSVKQRAYRIAKIG